MNWIRSNNTQLIIFDFDGVIVDSYELWYCLLRYLLNGFGRNIKRSEYSKIFGQGIDLDKKLLFPMLSEKQIEELYGIYYPFFLRFLRFNSEIKGLLMGLKGLDVKLACCTNTPEHLVLQSLKHVGINNSFDLVTTPKGKLRPKPFPDMIHHIVRSSGTDRESCVYVGDSIFDRKSCESAKVSFLHYDIRKNPFSHLRMMLLKLV
ncbi:MAG: HAD hydrolase-like protein [Planctomycetes bacterium]|nr:HAD hydrolase-like protein [Planctomycetota bacterium]